MVKGEGEGRNGENGMERRRKAEGLRVKGEGEGRKTAPPIPPQFKRVKGREKGERRPLLCPPPPKKKKKKKKKNPGHSDISCSTKRCLGASV